MKLILFLFILSTLTTTAQQVTFCESVDRFGIPKNASKEFTIGNDGGFIKILVKLKKTVNSKAVIYDVYRVTEGKEKFENTLRMEVQPALTWFYKEITFFKAGEYHVYVYDARDKLLGVGEVKINLK